MTTTHAILILSALATALAAPVAVADHQHLAGVGVATPCQPASLGFSCTIWYALRSALLGESIEPHAPGLAEFFAS